MKSLKDIKDHNKRELLQALNEWKGSKDSRENRPWKEYKFDMEDLVDFCERRTSSAEDRVIEAVGKKVDSLWREGGDDYDSGYMKALSDIQAFLES